MRFLEYQLSGFGLVLYLSAAALAVFVLGVFSAVQARRSRALRARIGAYTERR